MTEPRVWSVTQVNRAVRAMLEDTVESLWVSGEVANWTRARSGHCYFSLKDEQAQLRCVMFKAAAASLPADPEEGTTVRALGGLTLYEARGEYQLVVRRLEAEGAEGLGRQAFERLRAKLEVEGLLASDEALLGRHTHLLQTDVPPSERTVNYEIWAPPYISLIAKLETGSLRVENISEVITVETVVADVLLRNLSGHTSVETMDGSVQVERCSGRMEVTSISGSLRFLQTRTRRLVAKTTSGDIYFEGSLLRAAAYKFYNHEGSIELLLPANASFELTANSIKGQVYNDFPLTPSSHGRVPQRSYERSLFGTVHSGEAMVQVTSFSGTIRIRAQ